MYSAIRETVDFIRSRSRLQPALGLILGSGLGACAESLQNHVKIPYSELPHFPSSSVSGHPGNLIIGIAEGVPVVALQGRAHLYEGYSAADVAFPTRVLGSLGIRFLIATNAAGAIDPSLQPGDLMLITDHINMMNANPLVGPNPDALGPRFPDMSEAYDAEMGALALEVAERLGIVLRRGIYIGLRGPSYETPAEIRMCRVLGADAVGMSTIPEVLVAKHMGIRVLGISCITNMAAGVLPQKLTHGEVLETAKASSEKFESLLRGIISRLSDIPNTK